MSILSDAPTSMGSGGRDSPIFDLGKREHRGRLRSGGRGRERRILAVGSAPVDFAYWVVRSSDIHNVTLRAPGGGRRHVGLAEQHEVFSHSPARHLPRERTCGWRIAKLG